MSANLPPKQVIFNDPKHTQYDYWDLVLLKAYHFAEDFTRDSIPVWWDESDDVTFEVEKKISRSAAAVDRARAQENGKDKSSPPGRYFIPVPKTRGGRPFPTFEEWSKEQARKKGQK